MAVLAYQGSKPTGVALNLVAASGGGDKVKPNDHGMFVVRNGDGTATTVTLVNPGSDKYGSARPDPTFSVAAGATVVFGPLPKDLADPSDGKVGFTYSKTTSLTVGALSA